MAATAEERAAALAEIKALIPHREPFLLVDRIISCDGNSLVSEKYFSPELEVYSGHYPQSPVTPGVLLSEAIFQSGALLIAKSAGRTTPATGVPVLTRILEAKFKRRVPPGETVRITVSITERLAGAWFFKGTLRCGGKTAVQIKFACTLAPAG